MLFTCVSLSGQLKFKSNFTVMNTPLQLKDLGKSTHNFYYKVTFSTDKNSPRKKEAFCILQIGENVSKFFDFNQLRKDSVIQKYNQKNILNAREIEEILNIRVDCSTEILKNSEHMVVQDKFRDLTNIRRKNPNLFGSWRKVQKKS